LSSEPAASELAPTQLTYTCLPHRLLRIWALELKAPVAFAPMTNGLCCTFFPHGGIIATGYVCALNRWADSVCTMKEVWRTVMPFIDVSNQCKGKERPVCGPCYLNGQLHKEA
jgi:hypothetical protein